MKTNPNAIKTIQKNTIFTNVAETSDGGVYWEGIDEPLASGVTVTSWKNKEWRPQDGGSSSQVTCSGVGHHSSGPPSKGDLSLVGEPCAHPNSRFCTPASQCPIIDPAWESPEGVPIEGIIFGGRRPAGEHLLFHPVSMGVVIQGNLFSKLVSKDHLPPISRLIGSASM